MDKKEIEINGKKFVFRIYGEGKPVLLIHGFGELENVWKNQLDALSGKYRIIVPDLPGSGESDLIPDMSIEGMAEPIKIMMDEENIKKCCIIGHSMGGYITLAIAEKYPEYLEAFGLFHSTAFADTDEKKSTRRKGIDFIKEYGAFAFLKNTTPNLFSPATTAEKPGLIDEQIETLTGFTDTSLILYYEAMINRPDRTHILRNSTIPILFVAGKYDNAVPIIDSLKLCHLAPLSYFYTLENSGHMGMLEEAGKTIHILEEFLNTVSIT
jgi:pimeloyl-ACP methyl ester carboxylesterase